MIICLFHNWRVAFEVPPPPLVLSVVDLADDGFLLVFLLAVSPAVLGPSSSSQLAPI